GAEVWQEANVTEVITEPSETDTLPRVTGVVVNVAQPPSAVLERSSKSSASGGTQPGAAVPHERRRIECRVVVDATGTSSMLSRKFGIRQPDPKLRKASLFAHYRGGKRDPGKNEGATLVLSTRHNDGWFWYIPLHDDIVSV